MLSKNYAVVLGIKWRHNSKNTLKIKSNGLIEWLNVVKHMEEGKKVFRLGQLGTWVDIVTEQGPLWDQKKKQTNRDFKPNNFLKHLL